MHVATVGVEVDDRIAHELPRPVVGHVAAAAGVGHGDAQFSQPSLGRQNVPAPAVALHAEREHVRMLQQEQRVGNGAGLALLHERALQRQRLVVRHDAQAPDG